VRNNKQGQGPATAQKEEQFASAIRVNLQIVSAKVSFPYIHGDLHAGSGYNDERECDGSPVVFCREAVRQGADFRAFLCDRDLDSAKTLRQNALADDPRVEIYCCDNSEVLSRMEGFIRATQPHPDLAVGSIIIDPNGYFDEKTVPHERLIQFAANFQRIDLIFNLNLTTYHLGSGHKRNETGKWATKFFPHPAEIPGIFNRAHGLVGIRQPNGHSFITLVLRNFETDSHEKLGLYDIHGHTGRRMLEVLRSVGQLDLSWVSELPRVPAPSEVPPRAD